MRTKRDKTAVLEALRGSGGIIEEVRRRLGVSWGTVQIYINKWQETQELYEAERNGMKSIATSEKYTMLDVDEQRKINWIVARDAKVKSKGYVYFVIDNLLNTVKIGYAKTDYEKRFQALQCGCPQELIMYAVIESDTASHLEKELHRRYKNYLYRGEWYSIPKEEIDACIRYHEGVFLL